MFTLHPVRQLATARVMTAATGVATRTDRRPVAGGVHDAVAAKTFISWAGPHRDGYAQAYDHGGDTWSRPVRVAGGDDDARDYPAMIQAADGHLLVFRAHRRELRMARSAAAHDIGGGWADVAILEGWGAADPMPVRTADGTIFVFFRDASGARPITYVRSVDNGRTWQGAAALTGHREAIVPAGREVHIGQLRHEPATPLHPERIAIVYAPAGGGLHYTYFTPADLCFHAADGRALGTVAGVAGQEAYLRVADAAGLGALVGSTLCGWPFVLWTRPDAAGRARGRVALWSPLGWRSRELTAGVRVLDMERLDAKTWRIYAAGAPGVVTYRLTGGTDWRYESAIATAGAVRRIEMIADHQDPARILITTAGGDVAVAGLIDADTSDVCF